MPFLIRTVSTSAEGREIVRTARIEGDRLTIGRSPECDVRLTDLAVALRHVVVRRDASRLSVEVESGLTVALNGRSCASGEIETASGGDIRIGAHLLRFMPADPDSDEIAVTVERITEGEAKPDRSADRLFSLAPVLPGKRLMAWLLAVAVLVLCVAWPVRTFYDRQQRAERFAHFQADEIWSSGHLSKAHARLQHDCSACHVQPFESVRDAACLACHTQIHGHADPYRLARAKPELGAWGAFQLRIKQALNVPPGRCIDCHTEHQGPQEMAPTPQRFCADCHGDLSGRLPDTGIGDASDFGRVHPEFQPALITGWQGERPVVQRLSLARRPREDSGLKFPHALHLSPVGGPAQMGRRLGLGAALDCANCHQAEPKGTSFRPVEMERDCSMCHSLAFRRVGGEVQMLRHGNVGLVMAQLRGFYGSRRPPLPPGLAPLARRVPGSAPQAEARVQFERGADQPGPDAAVRAVFSPGGACYDCHKVETPADGASGYRVHPVAFPLRYVRHGWFDHRAHSGQECSDCHAARTSQSAADLLLPGIATCRTCHGGERTPKPVASSCAMCHDYHARAGAPPMIVRRRLLPQAPDGGAVAGTEARR